MQSVDAVKLREVFRGKVVQPCEHETVRCLVRGLATGTLVDLASPNDSALAPFCVAELERRGIWLTAAEIVAEYEAVKPLLGIVGLSANTNPQPTGAAPPHAT